MNRKKREFVLNCLLILSGTVLYFFANLQKVIIPGAIFDELQVRFGVSASRITWLGAGFMYIYSLGQLAVGVMTDRYSGSRVLAAGGVIFCAGSLLSAYDGSLWLLMFSRVLTGFGACTVYLSMVKMVTRISGSFFPVVLGMVTIVGYSGSVVGGTPFVSLVHRAGYSVSMLILGGVTAFFYLLYLLNCTAAELPPVKREVRFSWYSFKGAFANRHNICIWLTLGIGFGSFYLLQTTIGKKFMEDFAGVSASQAGMVLSVTMVMAAVNGFGLALLSRLLRNRRRIFMRFCGFGSFAGALLTFCCVLFEWRSWYIAVAGWIIMAFAGNCSPISAALIRETNEEHRFGTVLSISNGFAYLVIAVLGSAAGMLMDMFPPEKVLDSGTVVYGRSSYLAVFGFLCMLGAVAAIASLFLKETYGRNILEKER